jgi:hypothetical protein
MLTIIYGKSSSGKTTILHALKKPLSMVYDEADYEQLAEPIMLVLVLTLLSH